MGASPDLSAGAPFSQAPPPGAALELPRLETIDRAAIIARVDGDVILAGDVLPSVNETLAANKDKIPAEELDNIRRMLMQQRLEPLIETRLLYAEAVRKIPADHLPKINEKLGTEFEKGPLERMMQQAKVTTRQQLDARLREFGSSVAKEKQNFLMQVVARQWLQNTVHVREEVTRDEMLAYYQQHATDYDRPARVRWQELFLRNERFDSSSTARQELIGLGNRLLGGEDFAALARQHSHGFTAAEGGVHEWTTAGSLASPTLDNALLTLPPGRLSPIMEDERGWRIVRVIEREAAGRVPFAETQEEIKKAIRDERFAEARAKYLEGLRAGSYVWTAFGETLPSAQLSERPRTEPRR